jgi:hypothetical protein
MSTVDRAVALAARLPVFPCSASKRPTTPHGFKDATQDPARVRELWRMHDGPLIGYPTGESSNIDVLDIDPRHVGDVWLSEMADALPVTRRHRTQSGGWHILFRHANGVRNSESKIAPGVDTRGTGGYAIYWPAQGLPIENPATLDDWPKWLLKQLLPPPKPTQPPPQPASRIEATTRADMMVQRAFDRVRAAAGGQRHYVLRAAAATLGGLLWHLNWSEQDLQRHLTDLIMETGAADRANAERTAAWAIEKGRRAPLLGGA